MPVSFHFLYDKLLKSSQLNAGCLQHMHTAILFLKALYQSRAAITILTVMTSPQHVILSAAGTAASPAGLLHLYAGADRAPRQGNPFRMYGALYMEGAGRSCKGDTGEKEVVTGIGSVHYKAS